MLAIIFYYQTFTEAQVLVSQTFTYIESDVIEGTFNRFTVTAMRGAFLPCQ